jgi:hypothetical protein
MQALGTRVTSAIQSTDAGSCLFHYCQNHMKGLELQREGGPILRRSLPEAG